MSEVEPGLTSISESTRITGQLERWREQLIDLSSANPLISLERSRSSKLAIASPTSGHLYAAIQRGPVRLPLVRPVRRTAGAALDSDTPNFVVLPGDIEFAASPADQFRLLRRIRDNARVTVVERGVTTLHLVIGTVRWDDPRYGPTRAPLILVPCEFVSEGSDMPLRLQTTEDDPTTNPALTIYVRKQFQKSLPQLPDEQTVGSLGAYIHQVRNALGQDWQVEEDAWLGTFSYESLVLYEDLARLRDDAAAHDVVRALAGASIQVDRTENLALPHDLDSPEVAALLPIPILPADSSQLAALTFARQGRSVVIHGPPGTGKSQTIANLIADHLSRGRTVLFVSAKMAALEVVHDRLVAAGLGRFCLEAHGTKSGRTRVIDDLRRTLDEATGQPVTTGTDELDRAQATRDRLNQVVLALHRPREAMACSVFEAISRFARLYELRDVRFALPWRDPASATARELDRVNDLLRQIEAQSDLVADRDRHPWRGYRGEDTTRIALEHDLDTLRAALDWGRRVLAASTAFGSIGLPIPGWSTARLVLAADGLAALAEADWLPAGWASDPIDHLESLALTLESAAQKVNEIAEDRAFFRSATEGSDPSTLCAVLSPVLDRYRAWTRVFKSGYLQWRGNVREQVKPRTDTITAIRELALKAQRVESNSAWIRERATEIARTRGYVEGTVPSSALLSLAAQAFRHAVRLRRAFGEIAGLKTNEIKIGESIRRAAASLVAALPTNDPKLAESITALEQAWGSDFAGQSASETTIAVLVDRCLEIIGAEFRRAEWIQLRSLISRCSAEHLDSFLNALVAEEFSRACDVFQRRFWLAWIDRQVDGDPVLREFGGARQADLIRRFGEADAELRGAINRATIAGASIGAIKVNAAGFAGRDTQLGILRNELQRKRPRPLRRLFADIPAVLQAIKPCLLMSPISVSTFLTPGTMSFDLVVFDEASQIPPAEAIPAIVRSRQVVVAGDDNQLPPTTFFSRSVGFDDDADDPEPASAPLESLLKECTAQRGLFEIADLRWHYRSRDERLIAFSNHTFYEDRLITFPSPGQLPHQGVQREFVADGVWNRGTSRTNPVEARRVASVILRHLTDYPHRSIGAVALNASQKEAIEDAIEEATLGRPELRDRLAGGTEPFFVKSLENVQGDERDTIVISTGYGRAPDGQLRLNFGPLNLEGGWRRLNVLVTRARECMVLVTSLTSEELRLVSNENRGANALRQFIEYVERGGQISPPAARLTGGETNDFEDTVAAALRARGFSVDQQVGASRFRIDLAVRDPRDPNWYLLGIECDGATYHSSRTARDRDVLRAQILSTMGWRLYRVWSLDWFRNPTQTIDNLVQAIERASQLGRPVGGLPPAPDPPIGPAAQRDLDDGQSRPAPVATPMFSVWPIPYQRAAPVLPRRTILLDPGQSIELAKEIQRIVQAETPIHLDLLIDRLKSLHGVGRAGDNIRNNVDAALRRTVGRVRRDHADFLWWHESQLNAYRVPGEDEEPRVIGHIPQEEIEFAVIGVLERVLGAARESLSAEVRKAFGFRRTNPMIGQAIDAAVDSLVDTGRVRLSGNQLNLP